MNKTKKNRTIYPERRRKIWILLAVFVGFLIALRIALPYILLRVVNKELKNISGYTGRLDDLDVALIRGAYVLKGLHLDKTGAKVPVPFFSSDVADLSVQWNALFHGRIVGEIVLGHPVLNFVKGPTEATSQTKISKSWTTVVKKLMPLSLNRLEVNNGEVHYRSIGGKPDFNIFAKQVHILAENLSNVNKDKSVLPSPVDASADVYGGKVTVKMKMDALADTATFDAKAEMVGLNLTNLNSFIQSSANFDVKQGEISIYTEAAAKNGKIAGYVKPIIKNLKVLNWQRDKDKPMKVVKEAMIDAVAWIFKNHSKDQLATRADFEGNIKGPDIDVWTIVGEVLRNAFVQALYPSLENSISLGSLDSRKDQPETGMQKDLKKSKKDYKVTSSNGKEKKDKKDNKKKDERNDQKKESEQKKRN